MCGSHALPSYPRIPLGSPQHALRRSSLVGIYGGRTPTGIGLSQLLHQCQPQITDPISADQDMLPLFHPENKK